jgi:radical SAM protein with 4Fe4S-binding SPASM domain
MFDEKTRKDCERSLLRNGYLNGCTAGIHQIHVDPNGNVRPCQFLNVVVGNVKGNTLDNIVMNSRFLERLRNRQNLKGKCNACDLREICGGCRARAFYYSSDPFAEDPLCPLINERA